MPGLVPGIHALSSLGCKVVDGRAKPGHDESSQKVAALVFRFECQRAKGTVPPSRDAE
jgi:hypothetical protein